MFSTVFWKDVAERTSVTFAEALLALLLVSPHTPILGFDWPSALGLGATTALIAFLKAFVAKFLVGASVSPASFAPDDRGIH